VLHADVHPPVPVEPGQPERVDYEYERRGTRNLFVMVEPLAGWRHVEVTAQRTMHDYAKVVRWLVDEVYPQAEYIRLVQDNLNTHTPASLYETFPPARAAPHSATPGVPLHAQARQGARIWPRSRSPFWNAMPCHDAWKTRRRCVVRCQRWKPNATRNDVAFPGSSRGRDARRKLERLYPVQEPSSD
jgi:hypothetical protein